ncbi:HK97 gp10 family phage protein [Candidatus Saccharibacteria bacterium]|nr:HK97 gp10 family phage protein [Candidatus Saccharibacteria bacterium]
MAIKIEIRGVQSLIKKLDSVAEIDGAIRQATVKSTGIVQADAKQNAPVDTGNLKSSIKMNVEQNDESTTGTVSTATKYGMYVEFGAGVRGAASEHPKAGELGLKFSPNVAGQTAQPFMYPALKKNEAKIGRIFTDEVKKAAREAVNV